MQRKWAVNTMLMAFTGFSLVLVEWVLWVFKMGFGSPLKLGPGIFSNFVGRPGPILGRATQNQAQIPLLNGGMPQFRFPQSTLAYFQFVFAGITPLLFLGSVVGRINRLMGRYDEALADFDQAIAPWPEADWIVIEPAENTPSEPLGEH